MFNRANKIFKIIKNGTVSELAEHLERYPDSIELTKKIGKYPGSTPFLHAVYHQKHDMMRALKNAYADINACDKDRFSGFHLAMHHHAYSDSDLSETIETIKLLVELGVDIELKNIDGNTAFDYTNNDKIKKILNPAYIPPANTTAVLNQFVYENDHTVSYTDYAAASEITKRTLFDFEQEEVTTQLKDKGGQSCFVREFNQIADKTRINKAAEFLIEKGGNTHSYKAIKQAIS